MKYALCASKDAAMKEPVLYRGSYIDAAHFAEKLGYNGIEIHLRDPEDIDVQLLKEECQKINMGIAGIGTGLASRVDGLSLIDLDSARKGEAIARVKKHLDVADIFSCPVIIGSMKSNVGENESKENCLSRLRNSLNELGAHIKNKNCTLVLEAINRYENNYLNTATEIVEFIKTVDSDKIKLHIDTFHMNIEEKDSIAVIYQFEDYIGHVHFADNNRWSPGYGQMDFSRFIKALDDIGYGGWVSMECLPLPNEYEAAKQGINYLRRLSVR